MEMSSRTTEKIMKLALFDIDGCISSCEWRSRIAKDKKYDLFHSLSIYDEPIDSVTTGLKRLHTIGCEIHLITGRTEKYRQITMSWLAKYGIPYHSLYMRPDDDFRKASKLKMAYINDNFDISSILLFVEDNGHTMKSAKEAGINTFHFCETSERNIRHFMRLINDLT